MKVNKFRPFIIMTFIIGCFPLHSADHTPADAVKKEVIKKISKPVKKDKITLSK